MQYLDLLDRLARERHNDFLREAAHYHLVDQLNVAGLSDRGVRGRVARGLRQLSYWVGGLPFREALEHEPAAPV